MKRIFLIFILIILPAVSSSACTTVITEFRMCAKEGRNLIAELCFFHCFHFVLSIIKLFKTNSLFKIPKLCLLIILNKIIFYSLNIIF